MPRTDRRIEILVLVTCFASLALLSVGSVTADDADSATGETIEECATLAENGTYVLDDALDLTATEAAGTVSVTVTENATLVPLFEASAGSPDDDGADEDGEDEADENDDSDADTDADRDDGSEADDEVPGFGVLAGVVTIAVALAGSRIPIARRFDD